jgi:tight adherence protein C
MTTLLVVLTSLGLMFIFLSSAPANFSLQTRLQIQAQSAPIFQFNLLSFRRLLSRSVKRKITDSQEAIPEILDLLALSLSAGESLFASLALVAPRARGDFADELKRLLQALEYGADLESEIEEIALRLPNPQVQEFCSKVLNSLRRGSPLAQTLREQAMSVRAEIRNELLKQAGKNETRMLIPLVFLILPVTVIFATFPSLQLLNTQYL